MATVAITLMDIGQYDNLKTLKAVTNEIDKVNAGHGVPDRAARLQKLGLCYQRLYLLTGIAMYQQQLQDVERQLETTV